MTRPANPLARVDVLIVNYNAGDWLAHCIAGLRPDRAEEPNVIVVDNGSTDASLRALGNTGSANNGLIVERLGCNTGFAAGVNRAADHASRELLLILNPDSVLTPKDLARLIEELDTHPEAALVSGKVIGTDGHEQRGSRRRLPTPRRVVAEILHAGGERIDLTDAPAPEASVEVEAVSGACMLVRRTAFEKIDGMDEGYPLHFEDLDLFARLLEAGWTLRWVPDVGIVHAGGGYPLHFEDLDLFARLLEAGWTLRWVPDVGIVHAGGQSSSRRPVGVLWAKHRGLWRYLARHCGDAWPVWQRPLWFVVLVIHAVLRTPLVWATARSGRQ